MKINRKTNIKPKNKELGPRGPRNKGNGHLQMFSFPVSRLIRTLSLRPNSSDETLFNDKELRYTITYTEIKKANVPTE